MTQTLRDKVAETLAKHDHLAYPVEYDFEMADAALQALADHIGVTVTGLDHLSRAVRYVELNKDYDETANKIYAKLKGTNP